MHTLTYMAAQADLPSAAQYVSEAVTALAEANFKVKDISAVTQACPVGRRCF